MKQKSAPVPSGRVSLVGAGPGDPELLTLRAQEKLRQADLVLYDALVHPEILRHCRPDAVQEFVGKRAGRPSARQETICARMQEAATAGLKVVRLKGGDPYMFGRGSEEAEFLAAAAVPFDVVPGVSAPAAVAAYAGMSLTHRHHAASVAYLTATESALKDRSTHDWSKLATATQTLVIFMGRRKLASLMQLLIEHGRDPNTPAAVVQSASLPGQRSVVGTVATIATQAAAANVGMPALTVVGAVVGLRPELGWYEALPLFGQRIWVLRPEPQSRALCRALSAAGADAVALPMLRIGPPDDPQPLQAATQALSEYAWLGFTSQHGVEAFFTALHAGERDSRALAGLRIAAVGQATTAALAARGVRPDCVPAVAEGLALAQAMQKVAAQAADTALAGVRVLLARAQVARPELPQQLRAAGAHVDDMPAYQSLGPDAATCAALADAYRGAPPDAILFTSPSTTDHLLRALKTVDAHAHTWLKARTRVAIGPTTACHLDSLGLPAQVVARAASDAGLVQALISHTATAPKPPQAAT
ncbi:MAG: uroporphyrinogen-III C-methyltransferase [Polyangiales bacterium]